MNPLLTKSYEAAEDIVGYRIIAFADPDAGTTVGLAGAATDPLVGTSGKYGAEAGEMVDVDKVGLGAVQLGGAVDAGDPLTSDASGKAIAATEAGQRIIGFAEAPGVANDIIDYAIAPGVLAVPEA